MSAALGGVLLLALGVVGGAEETRAPLFTPGGPRLEADMVPLPEAGFCPPLESLGALYPPRLGEEGSWLPDPLSRAASLDPFRGARERLASQAPATLGSWLDALGTPLDQRLFVGVTIDLFGPEEVEALRPAPVDAQKSAPRITYLSTGLGLRFRF